LSLTPSASVIVAPGTRSRYSWPAGRWKNPSVGCPRPVKTPATPPELLIAAAVTLAAPGTSTGLNRRVAMSYR